MEKVDWRLKGLEYVNCNCDLGCPCQFMGRPSHGDCEAFAAVKIEDGYFGDTRLDGLAFAMTLKWPGAIHEGNGTAQAFVDERATPEQREALMAILSGETSEPGATFFNVFASTLTTMHDPVFCPIEISCDVEGRHATVRVADLIEASASPILSPIDGSEHRARIDLPRGFEYAVAEVATGKTSAHADVPMELSASHSHLAHLDIGPTGVYH
ncbi:MULTISPECIES: DUF1326 domain-containing protein [Marinobacter]|uniref:DUF1326 domain-containing protein n=1 Tax=Marinobacter suaedae TaxID=3057675 RepID=A0ABT8VXD5_9GAMM|nr:MULTISPECIES: DUF1326 domain-containing protein [unclassified Marinobacter]MBZ2168707.1 DUF1326 domain-containing protein [Marinobacter sp. F4216]MDO3720585.1 DUF1326 domain-containing protein [Marinobacter sp. chi1]